MQRQMKKGVLEIQFGSPPSLLEVGEYNPPVIHLEIPWAEVLVHFPGVDDETLFLLLPQGGELNKLLNQGLGL